MAWFVIVTPAFALFLPLILWFVSFESAKTLSAATKIMLPIGKATNTHTHGWLKWKWNMAQMKRYIFILYQNFFHLRVFYGR